MVLDDGCLDNGAVRIKVLRDRVGGDSTVRIRNENTPLSNLKVYLVDDCLIREGIRCDYLFLPNEAAAVFVELKGTDVSRGLSQLGRSISVLLNEVEDRALFAVLVVTRCPIAQSNIAVAQDRFFRQHKCRLVVRSRVYSCNTSDFH